MNAESPVTEMLTGVKEEIRGPFEKVRGLAAVRRCYAEEGITT
jgi:hypothetical protein